MYKKVVLFALTLFVAMSCLDSGSFTTSYSMIADMEYSYKYDTIFGSDSLYFDDRRFEDPTVDAEAPRGVSWGDGVWNFYNTITEENAFQGGFLLSYLDKPKPETTGLLNNKYRVNCAAPKNTINTYLVYEQVADEAKMPKQDFQFMLPTYGTCTMTGCHVNNTVALAEAAVQHLELGEKVLLRATGYKEGAKTGYSEIVLVEKSSPKDSVMSHWTEFKLDALHAVDVIDFELIIPEGKEIPATVCVDNLTAQIVISY